MIFILLLRSWRKLELKSWKRCNSHPFYFFFSFFLLLITIIINQYTICIFFHGGYTFRVHSFLPFYFRQICSHVARRDSEVRIYLSYVCVFAPMDYDIIMITGCMQTHMVIAGVKSEWRRKVCVKLTASNKNPVKFGDINLININVKARSLLVSNGLHRHHPGMVTSKGWARRCPEATRCVCTMVWVSNN